jgi:transcriptional regulator with XRE-family HTH domain
MEKLRNYLKVHNIKQCEFAKLLGINNITLWRYLQGSRIPRLKIMKKIIELTNGYVTANDFFGDK